MRIQAHLPTGRPAEMRGDRASLVRKDPRRRRCQWRRFWRHTRPIDAQVGAVLVGVPGWHSGNGKCMSPEVAPLATPVLHSLRVHGRKEGCQGNVGVSFGPEEQALQALPCRATYWRHNLIKPSIASTRQNHEAIVPVIKSSSLVAGGRRPQVPKDDCLANTCGRCAEQLPEAKLHIPIPLRLNGAP